jgi:hypothetical protein
MADGLLLEVFVRLVGLVGAEFWLPLLIGVLRFAALPAVISGKAMSLIVVPSALPFPAVTVTSQHSVRIGPPLPIC